MAAEGHVVNPQQMARKHIFCVNGVPEFLDVLRQLFQDEQYNVTTTNYVPNTFAMIDALQPDLILIDLELGQQAGFDLLQRVSHEASTRGVPVIVTSTMRHLLDQAEADPEHYGATTQVLKPLDLDALLAAIDRLIGPA